MTTPLRDPLAGGGTKTVAPTVSFQCLGLKKPFTGIVVPVEVDGQTRPYAVTQQRNQKGEYLFFDKRGEKGVPDLEAPRTQIDVTFISDMTDWAGTSEEFRERQDELDADDRLEDFGQRRVIIKGGDATKALREELRKHGLTALEVGGTLTITLVKRVQKENSEFKSNVFEYSYVKATSESIKKAMDAFDRLQELRGEGKGADDSGSGAGGVAGGGTGSDEPPF